MKIILIRHGDPDNANDTLTMQGFKEINALADMYRDFDFKDAYCSPLTRAQLTAKAFLEPHKKGYITLEWLKEFTHYVRVPYCNNLVQNWDFLPSYFTENKELYDNDKYLESEIMKSGNIKDFYKEVTDNFDELLSSYGYKREKNYYRVIKESRDTIIFFCHLGIMSVIMSHLMNIPYVVLIQTFACLPSGLTTLVSEEREEGIAQFRCLQYGDLSHLRKENIKPSFHGRFCETFNSKERH